MAKEYKVGLVMGVFDLFHVGHLNLLKRAKEKCEYLRAGILSDALVREYKKHDPVIPEEERRQIVEAIRYVDEAVIIYDDPSRLVEYDRRPFDCFFSGDDYMENEYFLWEKKQLQKKGADIYFLPYTKKQSSTKIRKKMKSI